MRELGNTTHRDGNSNAEAQRRYREKSILTPYNPTTKSTPDPCLELTASEEEEEENWRKGEDVCGRLVKEMTHEEWKIIDKWWREWRCKRCLN